MDAVVGLELDWDEKKAAANLRKHGRADVVPLMNARPATGFVRPVLAVARRLRASAEPRSRWSVTLRRALATCCVAIGQIATLSGCVVWPTMTLPAIRMSVHDPEGRPIDGASFYFAKYSISMVPRSSVRKIETDRRGRVAFEGDREWRFFFLAPDGGARWSWSWCIEKPGFQAVLANDLRTHPRARDAAIVLTPGAAEQHCIWRERPPAFDVHHGAL